MSALPPSARPYVRSPLATPAEIAAAPTPFPKITKDAPCETVFADWRQRLVANLARRSDGRWDPLTRTHARDSTP